MGDATSESDKRLKEMRKENAERFDEMEKKIAGMEKKIDGMEKGIEQIVALLTKGQGGEKKSEDGFGFGE